MNLFILLEFISGGHILLIVLVLVLLFGGKKIPELMKGLGQGIREFKKASNGEGETSTEIKKEEKK
jgi:sec-independent protein translocase protein TatA